jgi:hypothetical protein
LYKDKSFDELTRLSHQHAWNSAQKSGMNTSIRIDEILDEIGADSELRKYVKDDILFRQAL